MLSEMLYEPYLRSYIIFCESRTFTLSSSQKCYQKCSTSLIYAVTSFFVNQEPSLYLVLKNAIINAIRALFKQLPFLGIKNSVYLVLKNAIRNALRALFKQLQHFL